MAEFAAKMQEERNTGMRASLAALIRRTAFGSAGSLAVFRRAAGELLRGHPADLAAFRSLAASTYHHQGPVPPAGPAAGPAADPAAAPSHRRSLLAALDRAAFDFDQTTLRELQGLSRADAVSALAAYMAPLVELAAPGAAPANIYVACSATTNVYRPHCAPGRPRPRLAVPPGKLDQLVSILAADVQNPVKAAAFVSMAAGTISELDFIVRPGEQITLMDAA